ncbi:MAG: hypothetical protein KDD35_12125, partial [Bdellovibrionales bacterium]|nr:hypothetical protein [Bdellovibrionales bacterium]
MLCMLIGSLSAGASTEGEYEYRSSSSKLNLKVKIEHRFEEGASLAQLDRETLVYFSDSGGFSEDLKILSLAHSDFGLEQIPPISIQIVHFSREGRRPINEAVKLNYFNYSFSYPGTYEVYYHLPTVTVYAPIES